MNDRQYRAITNNRCEFHRPKTVSTDEERKQIQNVLNTISSFKFIITAESYL